MRRATALTAVLTLLCLAAFAGAAGASFPGRNGLIAFSSNRSGQSYDLYLMTARGRVTTRLTMTWHVNEGSPAWSADGRRVAFTGASTPRITRPDLWVMDSDGSDKRRLTFTRRASEREPDWSPNGRLIAYMSNVEGLASGQSAIYTMRPDGTHQRGSHHSAHAHASPAGRRTARGSPSSAGRAGCPPAPCAVDDGRRRLERAAARDREIGTRGWSPDGNSILFDATEPHPLADIFSIPPGGGEPMPLVSGPADDNSPAWQPRPGPARLRASM
jgi:Tol biopolymer transport system component